MVLLGKRVEILKSDLDLASHGAITVLAVDFAENKRKVIGRSDINSLSWAIT